MDNLVSVGVDEIGIEFDILALHHPCPASFESIHCASLCVFLQDIYTGRCISEKILK